MSLVIHGNSFLWIKLHYHVFYSFYLASLCDLYKCWIFSNIVKIILLVLMCIFFKNSKRNGKNWVRHQKFFEKLSSSQANCVCVDHVTQVSKSEATRKIGILSFSDGLLSLSLWYEGYNLIQVIICGCTGVEDMYVLSTALFLLENYYCVHLCYSI